MEMNGPSGLFVPTENPRPWNVFSIKAGDVLPEELAEAEKLEPAAGADLEKRTLAERACFDEKRQLTDTRAGVSALLTRLQEEFQRLWLPSMDELLDTLDACDSLALSERLRPYEYHIKFVMDAKDRLEVRIRAAILRCLEATVERCKVEALEAQLLAFISHGRTVIASRAILADEGECSIIGKRTETLRAIARQKMEAVTVAENELRAERNRQLTAEQVALAHGTVTRAQVFAAIPSLYFHTRSKNEIGQLNHDRRITKAVGRDQRLPQPETDRGTGATTIRSAARCYVLGTTGNAFFQLAGAYPVEKPTHLEC